MLISKTKIKFMIAFYSPPIQVIYIINYNNRNNIK
jgi:hypothetical protein